jgi:hypothetical protein
VAFIKIQNHYYGSKNAKEINKMFMYLAKKETKSERFCGIKMKALLRHSVPCLFSFNTAQGTIITWKTRRNSNPLRGLKPYQGSLSKTDYIVCLYAYCFIHVGLKSKVCIN